MRRINATPERWYLVPIPPESKTNASFRWPDVAIILYLALLVLGLLIIGITDHPSAQSRHANSRPASQSRQFDASHPQVAAANSKGFEIRAGNAISIC